MVEGHYLLGYFIAVSIQDSIWDIILCSTSSNRSFGGFIVSSLRVPSVDIFPQLWNLKPLKMESIRSPKRRFELVLHGTKSQKASLNVPVI
jgi:hypothetical protein